ncbi:MAG: LytTR family transcriptional regulator, partial [Bacteroidales bacterium]|nr:LytTR family transcriptional regulator [Bacteroidales bacterium]
LDYPIDPATLLYIESDKNYCKITTAVGTSVLRSTLTTLENQLKPLRTRYPLPPSLPRQYAKR